MNWRTKYENAYITGKSTPVEEIKPEETEIELKFYLRVNDYDKILMASWNIGWKL